MKSPLTKPDIQLCNILQQGLPISWRPFQHIADRLNITEQEVIRRTQQLKEAGIIRRIGAVINYRSLGRVSTLVTAHVPQKKINMVASAVNALTCVSHNYLRENNYNMWFTMQGSSADEIQAILKNLSKIVGVNFHSMPARRAFKQQVFFDLGGITSVSDAQDYLPRSEPVVLSSEQKYLLSKIPDDLPIGAEPFALLCDRRLDRNMVLAILGELFDKGVIRRIGAILDHRRLGFVENVLTAFEVERQSVAKVGRTLAGLQMVTHCFERETFSGWPYNLFAMMHVQDIDVIQQKAAEISRSSHVSSHVLLPTLKELKKQPVRYVSV